MQLKQCNAIVVMEMNTMIRRYSELKQLNSFEERFNYLKLNGTVSHETFGVNRYLNQVFYKSDEWLSVRDKVIIRDQGCDLGIIDREIIGSPILVHHMNVITMDDIINKTDFLLNPDYLITTTKLTHNAIHYGASDSLKNFVFERKPNDMCPWKK